MINKRSITTVIETYTINKDIIFDITNKLILVCTIDKIAPNKENKFEVAIDINVSFTTSFSVLLSLSILLIKIAANPNKTVKKIEKTVVNKLLNSSSIIKSSPKTTITAINSGIIKKQKQSQREIFCFLSFLNTFTCARSNANSRTFLLKKSKIIRSTDNRIPHIIFSFIFKLLNNKFKIIICNFCQRTNEISDFFISIIKTICNIITAYN